MFRRLYHHLALPSYDAPFLLLLLLCECIFGVWIIHKVPYTEIDWIAYMQQVEGCFGANYNYMERDYMKLRGDTGPLVYPAGFLYLFAGLRMLTDSGTHIRIAQYLFLGMYVLTQWVVFLLYQTRISAIRNNDRHNNSSNKKNNRHHNAASQNSVHTVWAWRIAMAILCGSKRLHSIFLLRLFNDGPAMLLLYVSIYLFTRQHWNVGCLVFSLAVSIKMNILLFAPGLMLLLLQASPNLFIVVLRLGLGCALPQVILGLPFLWSHPVSYLRKAFEFDRVFEYQWTVNWKCVSKTVFLSKSMSFSLLALHVLLLGIACRSALRKAAASIRPQTHRRSGYSSRLFLRQYARLTPHYITTVLFVSNFIGIVCARTLHYQFYSWYVHTLPYLLWSTLSLSLPPIRTSTSNTAVATLAAVVVVAAIIARLLLLMGLEWSFLTYPATASSSFRLQVIHWIILWVVWLHGCPSPAGAPTE